MEGAGVLLRRSVSPRTSNEYDPFLLFDHFAFNNPLEGPIRGFPMHPHRGIETVTYMLDGSVNHRDSLGNAGMIGPGDVVLTPTPTYGQIVLSTQSANNVPNGMKAPLFVNWNNASQNDVVSVALSIAASGNSFNPR